MRIRQSGGGKKKKKKNEYTEKKRRKVKNIVYRRRRKKKFPSNASIHSRPCFMGKVFFFFYSSSFSLSSLSFRCLALAAASFYSYTTGPALIRGEVAGETLPFSPATMDGGEQTASRRKKKKTKSREKSGNRSAAKCHIVV